MNGRLPWILMGGGIAIILVTGWCRFLIDVDRVWSITALVVGLLMVGAGAIINSKGGNDKSGNDESGRENADK
ncbi:hypothetical protein [Ruminococcus sp. FC2018]|uniref:hypothetical protein n=1 Tax=Ruminococcus sp. FC2018 TaxID=1410617 RepID=UPI00048E9BFF|nr:hypothetical protein [Ruminococcus sp. FC2018]